VQKVQGTNHSQGVEPRQWKPHQEREQKGTGKGREDVQRRASLLKIGGILAKSGNQGRDSRDSRRGKANGKKGEFLSEDEGRNRKGNLREHRG